MHNISLMLFFFLVLFAPQCADGSEGEKKTYYPDYNVYHSVETYLRDVALLPNKYPTCIKIIKEGRSREGRELHLLKMTDYSREKNTKNEERHRVLITFGEHAREFLPVESFFKLVNEFCSGLSEKKEEISKILGEVEVYLIGMVNPDGRNYLETKKDWCWRGMSNGVDVNRNFDWEWGGKGSSADPKNEEFRGVQPFSEPESRFVRDAAEEFKIQSYLSMHTGAQFVFVPYSDTKSKLSKRTHSNTRDELSLAVKIWASTRGFFSGLGIVYDMNDYTADGTIADYMAGKRGVEYSMTFELYGKPGDLANCFEQFNPDNTQLDNVLDQFHSMYPAIFNHLAREEARRAQLGSSSGGGYAVYEDVDSEGGDLYKVDLTSDKKMRVELMKEMCDALSECEGFNSAGWLKKNVKDEAHRAASSGSQLYIKRSQPVVPAVSSAPVASAASKPVVAHQPPAPAAVPRRIPTRNEVIRELEESSAQIQQLRETLLRVRKAMASLRSK